jgi:hypothetical protein
MVDATGDPAGRSLLLDKLTDAEPEVRSAALQAVLALNDTNAIPRIEAAAQTVENPREKVALLDAVAFLQLPETMPATTATNDNPRLAGPRQPKGTPPPKGGRASRRMQSGQGQGQPPGLVPPAGPPQSQPAPQDQPAPQQGQPAPQDQPAPQQSQPAPDPAATPPQ